jgi:peptidoglycan-associated lipoprotein
LIPQRRPTSITVSLYFYRSIAQIVGCALTCTYATDKLASLSLLLIFRPILQESAMRYRPLRVRSLIAVLIVFVAVGACRKRPPETPPPPVATTPPIVKPDPPPPAPPPPTQPPSVPSPVVPSEDEIFARMTLDQLNASKPLAPVYFDLDRADLTDAGRDALQKNAAWMKRWMSTKVTIEGHADNRGTNEYNLALGERRAAAVRDYMASLGIAADRMSIVSKGEEQPACTQDTESCWQENRRGFFVITAK